MESWLEMFIDKEIIRRGGDARDAYINGLTTGLGLYSWMREGVRYVGTAGMTLKSAENELIEYIRKLKARLKREDDNTRLRENMDRNLK